MPTTNPCLTIPRPLATPHRADSRLVYQCTQCGTTWPIAGGMGGHPRADNSTLTT